MNIDRVTIEQAQNGDAESFEALVAAFEKPVISTIYRMLNDIEAAQDIAQEVFLSVYKALHRFDLHGDASFKTWLFTIVRNKCFTELKKRKMKKFFNILSFSIASEKPSHNPDTVIHESELSDTVRVAVDKLPEKQRIIFVLREYENMSYEEIAEIAGCPVGTVRSNLARARDALRESLGGYVNNEI